VTPTRLGRDAPAARHALASNRLAAIFFLITLLAIGALYLYVAPGLQSG